MHSFEMEDLIKSFKKISYLIPMTHAKLHGLQFFKDADGVISSQLRIDYYRRAGDNTF